MENLISVCTMTNNLPESLPVSLSSRLDTGTEKLVWPSVFSVERRMYSSYGVAT